MLQAALELATEYTAVLVDYLALAAFLAHVEEASEDRAVFVVSDAVSVLHTVNPRPLIHRIISIGALSVTLYDIQYPIASVNTSLLINHGAAALFFVVVLLADVHIATCVGLNTLANSVTVLPLANVHAPVGPFKFTEAIVCVI